MIFPLNTLNMCRDFLAVTHGRLGTGQRWSKVPTMHSTDTTTVNNLAQDVHHPNIEEPWVKEYLHFESYSCHQIFPYNVVTCHVSARNIRESPLLLVPKFSAHIWQTFKFFLMAILWKMADFLDHILSYRKYLYRLDIHFDLPVMTIFPYNVCPFFYSYQSFK